jgi:hypothetical protein
MKTGALSRRTTLADRRLIAVLLAVLVIGGVGLTAVYLGLLNTGLQPVTAPDSPPGSVVDPITVDNLRLTAVAEFTQDYVPPIPSEGAPFHVVVTINITNTGTTNVTDFMAPRLTIYYNNTLTPLVTLPLNISGDWPEWPLIRPGETVELDFNNLPDPIFSPSLDEGTGLYVAVLVSWGGVSDAIIITPPSQLVFLY